MKGGFAKNSILVFLTKILQIGAGIIAQIIIGRTLGPEGNGLYAVAFSTINIINSVTSMGVNRAITVTYVQGKIPLPKLYGNLISMHFCVSSIAMAAVALTYTWGAADQFGWNVMIWAVLCVPFMLLIDWGNGVFLAKQEMRSFNGSQLQRYAGYLLATFISLVVLKIGNLGVTLAFFIGTVCGALSPIIRLRKEAWHRPQWDSALIRSLLGKGLQYAVAAFIVALNYRVNVLILDYYETPVQVGLFSASINVVESLWQLPTALGTVLIAKSANAATEAEAVDRSCRVMRVAWPITAALALVLAAIAPWIIKLFFGSKVTAEQIPIGVTAIHILLPGVVFGVIYKVLSSDLAGRGEPLFAARAYVIAVVANIALSFYLIGDRQMGAQGAAIASSVGYTIGAVLFVVAYARRHQVSLVTVLVPRASDFKPLAGAIQRKLKRGKSK